MAEKSQTGGALPRTTRRGTVAGLGAAMLAPSLALGAAPRRLKAGGPARALPARIFGVNSVAPYDIPIEDPRIVPVIKALGPHILRFPGGTIANYFNWRTGKIAVEPRADGSVYRRFLAEGAVPASHRLHPEGVTFAQYHALAETIGAEIILVPNLETSTIAEQEAWIVDLAGRGMLPKRIEMGNEFYLALLMDPAVLAVWPDWPTARTRIRSYHEAFRRHLQPDAKVAVQVAGSRFHHVEKPQGAGRERHEWEWDDAMTVEDWYEAVTAHLYVTPEACAGPGAVRELPRNLEKVFKAMMARSDEGFARALGDIEVRMPGKEIWVTEWGGFSSEGTFAGVEVRFTGMWLHVLTRSLLAMLRHPSVTVTNQHALFFSGNLSSQFRRVPGGKGYAPINAAGVMAWFNEAGRGPGVTYQPVTIEGAARIAAEGTIRGETFEDVAGGLFEKGGVRTLLVQNATAGEIAVDLVPLGAGAPPTLLQTVATPDLHASLQDAVPEPRPLAGGFAPSLPGFSVTRAIWS